MPVLRASLSVLSVCVASIVHPLAGIGIVLLLMPEARGRHAHPSGRSVQERAPQSL